MSEESLLFRLPHAWLVEFLSEWLDMPTIGMLETAISYKEYRPQFLNCLQGMRSTAVDEFSDDHDSESFFFDTDEWTGCWWRWLSVRQIYVELISLRRNDVQSVLVIPSMREATIENFGDEDLLLLVAKLSCIAITHPCSPSQG